MEIEMIGVYTNIGKLYAPFSFSVIVDTLMLYL